MKTVKRIMVCMMAFALVFCVCASAAELNCAARVVDPAALERYPSYACDEATGKWSVRANQADGLLERFWTYGKANSTPLCAFDLEIEGNLHTGIRVPVLKFYYVDGLEIDATAVSILIGDTRYDLAAYSEWTENDRHKAEVITAPLTREAMGLIDALAETEEASVRLLGERIYTFEPDMATTNSRRRIETASLDGMTAAKTLMEEAGFDGYDLWDLSAAAWEAEHGFAPAFAENTVVKMIRDTEIYDDFGMVIKNNQNRAARIAQEILIEGGFMSGTATGTFGTNSISAARRAQRYLGLIETGCMDAQLEKAIAAGVQAEAQAETELVPVGESIELSLERWWFANGIAPENSTESLYMAANRDNVFLAADGMIRNVSGREMRLFTQLEAKIVYGDRYEFEAHAVCERDEGTSMDMIMLPMAQARLVVYGEVPAWLAREDGAEWKILLTADNESIEYVLQ